MAKTQDKSVNVITYSESLETKERKRRPYDDYYCIYSFTKKPISEAWVNILCEELRKWADFDGDEDKKNESLRINDFYDGKGILPKDYYRLVDKWPQLKATHEYALRKIGSRRERGAMHRRYEASTIKNTIGYYCEISREEQKRLAALREESESNHENVQFVLLPAPKTGKVKPKKLKVVHENIETPE